MNGELARHIGDIARAILGEPNNTLSTRTQLRFGQHGSIAVDIRGSKAGSWFDHESQQGGGPWDLIRIKLGKVDGDAVDWLKAIGIEIDPTPSRRTIAIYDYRDEHGQLLFQVVRFEPKDFRQRRPDGAGGWVWNTKGVRKVLYRLPELIATPLETCVFIPEGEKDVDNLIKLGLVATCNPGGATKQKPGASKWLTCFGVFFKGRNVVILPDNDEAGREHAEAIAQNVAPLAASTKILDLAADCPSLPPKGDVSLWLAGGGGRDRLERLALAVTSFQAPDSSRKAPARGPSPQDDLLSHSEDAVALEFSDRYSTTLRYVNPWHKWLQWTGDHWRLVEDLFVFHLVRTVAREFAKLHEDPKLAKDAATAAIERLARNDRRHDVLPELWDVDPGFFNTTESE
jgi:putative DNA primase/helicase